MSMHRPIPIDEVIARIGDYTLDAILITEADPINPRILWTNKAFSDLTGYSQDELIGQVPRILQGEQTSPEATAKIRAALGAWQSCCVELLNYTRDGTPFWVELMITPVVNRESGLTDYWISVQRDITQRVHDDQQLRYQSRAVAAASDGILICETDPEQGTLVRYASPGYYALSGLPPDAVMDHPPQLLVGPETDRADAHRIARAADTGKNADAVIRTYRADGDEFWCSVRVTPIQSGSSSNETLLIFHDVTQIRARERELSQSQKLTAVGQLAGGVAHDFNNALTVIMCNLESVMASVDDPRARRCLDAAFRASRGAAELTSQLLALASPERDGAAPVDVRTLLLNIESMLDHTLPATIELECRVSEDMPLVRADSSRLESALVNMALNARDAMPEGGRLLIAADAITLAEDTDGLPEGEYVAFVVKDNGSGMSEEIKHRVFDPFFTTKQNSGGSGLGLSMVYAFVNQSGGRIRVDSSTERGTRFRFLLPAVARRRQVHVTEFDDRSVLVVEDNASLRELLTDWLRRSGFAVTVTESATNAWEMLQEQGQGFDLLLTDVMLPGGMDGMELVRRVRGSYPELAILLTTGYTTEAMPDEFDDGPGEFLPKPFTLDALSAAIRRLMNRTKARKTAA